MQRKHIARGKWYQTTHGYGQVVSVDGRPGRCVEIRITGPMPRGTIRLTTREVQHEIAAPEPAQPTAG